MLRLYPRPLTSFMGGSLLVCYLQSVRFSESTPAAVDLLVSKLTAKVHFLEKELEATKKMLADRDAELEEAEKNVAFFKENETRLEKELAQAEHLHLHHKGESAAEAARADDIENTGNGCLRVVSPPARTRRARARRGRPCAG